MIINHHAQYNVKTLKNPLLVLVFLVFLGILVDTLPLSADITSSLVGYWNFDEGSGITATDSSGNNNTGTLVNGPTWVPGKIGIGSLSFDGVDDRVTVAHNASLTPAAITISAWIKPATDGVTKRIIDKNPGYLIRRLTNGAVQFIPGFINSNATAPSGAWTHIVITADSTGTNWYINGVLDKVTSTAYAPSGTASLVFGGNLDFYAGDLDDVRIYNRALSASEVTELYNYTGGGDTIPPVLSAGSPYGSLPAGTTQTALSVTTDANATCKYGTTSGTAYSAMTNAFSATGETLHSSTITGLTDGTSYNYYIKCQD